MAIHSVGFLPNRLEKEIAEREFQLFCENISLILEYRQEILNCVDYFFCSPKFAWCSWAYVAADGPLYMGYLLIGWEENVLTTRCTACRGGVLVTSFSGSPLSGSNRWSGICLFCRNNQKGSWSQFVPRLEFVSSLRQKYPAQVGESEEYSGFTFSFGGNGLQPAIKKRPVQNYVANPISFETLIADLKTGNIQTRKPPNVSMMRNNLAFKLSHRKDDLILQL